jgi:signal peptidase I
MIQCSTTAGRIGGNTAAASQVLLRQQRRRRTLSVISKADPSSSVVVARRFTTATIHNHQPSSLYSIQQQFATTIRKRPSSLLLFHRRWISNASTGGGSCKRPPQNPTSGGGAGATAAAAPSWQNAVQEVVPLVGVFAWRLCLAYGFVYVFWEYGAEITICEGPSMIPTLKGEGDEIVLLDRWTPYRLGLQGGSSASQRAVEARQRQRDYVQQQLLLQQSTTTTTSPFQRRYPHLWHTPKIPANAIPSQGMWERLWRQWTTPISVGDVVVLQHPHRAGTVCKRVLGLPGDTVFTPRSQKGADQFFYQQHEMDTYYLDVGSSNSSSSSSLLSENGVKEWKRGPAYSTKIPYQTNLPRLKRQHRNSAVVVPDGALWVEGDNPWNSNDSRNYGPIPASLIVGRVICRIWPITGTNARMERGDRPIHHQHTSKPSWSFSGSIVFPAGYNDEIIVRDYQQWQQIMLLLQQQQQQQQQQLQQPPQVKIAKSPTVRDLNAVAAAEPKEAKPE